MHGAATVLAGTAVQEHERGLGRWQAEWGPLSQALAFTGGAAAAIRQVLSGLEVDADRMRQNMSELLTAEHASFLLTGRVGRAKAHELVGEAARSGSFGQGLLDAGLTEEEVDARSRPRRVPGRRAGVRRSRARLLRAERMSDEAYDRGMEIRREVLGDEHVDAAIERTTPFTADFQDLITRYAWGEIWSRPGLDRRTRSCMTLTALVALNRLDELALHVRAALRNGLTPDEIKEVLLHSAIYCGVPAANAAFAVAQRALDEAAEG